MWPPCWLGRGMGHMASWVGRGQKALPQSALGHRIYPLELDRQTQFGVLVRSPCDNVANRNRLFKIWYRGFMGVMHAG